MTAIFKPLDPGRVDMVDPIEVAYWCRVLHCSEAQLREAVSKVGTHITVVRQHLPHPPAKAEPAIAQRERVRRWRAVPGRSPHVVEG
jgi:Protein of unknown function (DUF3606)